MLQALSKQVSGSYHQTLEQIFSKGLVRRFAPGEKANIDHMRVLCKHFGNPQNKFKSIHIAGTNGKSSVATRTALALQNAGLRIGLFTSLHISSFRERVQINSENIAEENLIDHAMMVLDAIESKGIKATFHDVVTMIGFLEFEQQKVDLAVITCNLGGRLDSTNVLQNPEATAITSVSYDNMEYLGTSLEQIAHEKAGIIKQGVPCIIGPTVNQDAVFRKAKEMGGRLIQIKKKNFMKANQEIVEKLVESLGIKIHESDLTKILNQDLPCRLQKVPSSQIAKALTMHAPPIVYLDISNNPSAIENVVKEISGKYPKQGLQIVCGFQKNKDYTTFLHYLATHKQIKSIYPITVDDPNVYSIAEMMESFQSIQKLICSFEHHSTFHYPIKNGDMTQTLIYALRKCSHDQDVLLVCGTPFIMKDVRGFFKYNDERDEKGFPHSQDIV